MKLNYFWYFTTYITFICPCYALNKEKISDPDYEKSILNRIRQEEIMESQEPSRDRKHSVARQLKVMNYNVLAQDLLEQHGEYYQLHSPENLVWETRSRILFEQITTFLPDILGLQEVQETHIDSFYKKLEAFGYRGIFKRRTGNKTDGCSLYYMSSLMDLIEYNTVEYYRPHVSRKLLNRPNIAIIARLRSKSSGPSLLGRELIVANTHLLYNPRRDDVRVAQLQILLAEIDKMIKNMKADEKPAVLLMGDLNSLPESPVVKLLIEGRISSVLNHLPRQSGISNECTYIKNGNSECTAGNEENLALNGGGTCDISSRFKDELKLVEDNYSQCNLSHNLNFKSVYHWQNKNKHKLATTYQERWIIVDYMFYTTNMKLISRLKLPTTDECTNEIGWIPNKASPSDHFPLAATFLVE